MVIIKTIYNANVNSLAGRWSLAQTSGDEYDENSEQDIQEVCLLERGRCSLIHYSLY
jgi:hypothetical protein